MWLWLRHLFCTAIQSSVTSFRCQKFGFVTFDYYCNSSFSKAFLFLTVQNAKPQIVCGPYLERINSGENSLPSSWNVTFDFWRTYYILNGSLKKVSRILPQSGTIKISLSNFKRIINFIFVNIYSPKKSKISKVLAKMEGRLR